MEGELAKPPKAKPLSELPRLDTKSAVSIYCTDCFREVTSKPYTYYFGRLICISCWKRIEGIFKGVH